MPGDEKAVYELLDFGGGRKLEQFGNAILDRPCPQAAGVEPSTPSIWRSETARYMARRVGDGEWSPDAKTWKGVLGSFEYAVCSRDSVKLHLELLPSGQVGVFPEQAPCWRWIADQAGRLDRVEVLNLFAYTGGSTLAAAGVGGAEVVHVDAAKSVVERARQNAAASGLADRPIRWIVEDALKFCQREVKRGNRYDAVILDPPTYGHGPKGEEWQIKRDLLPLLVLCGELTERRPKFALITCHTPAIGPAELAAYLSDGLFGHCGQPPRTGELFLESSDGRRLPSGVFARWPA